MNTTCNSRTTCRRGPTYSSKHQQQQQQHAAAEACSSSKLQKQQAATSTNTHKCGLSCAPPHPRWNQRHHNEKIAPICALSSSATIQNNKKEIKKSCEALVPKSGRPTYTLHAVAPCQRLTQTDLASCRRCMYVHIHHASSAVSAPQQRPRQGSTVMNKGS